MNVLSVHALRKSFGGVRAVDDVSFDVEQGKFLALIGPNGAGKSTCFNMINGQLLPDAGVVAVDESHHHEERRHREHRDPGALEELGDQHHH